MTRYLNALIRLVTLGCRFIIVFILAKYTVESDVTSYGLIVAIVTYALYFVGLDLYIYSSREYYKKGKTDWGWMIKSQAIFFLMMYFFVISGISLLMDNIGLPYELLVFICILIWIEHINQELIRFFVIVEKQLVSSVILFCKSGSWVFILFFSVYFFKYDINLNDILIMWSIGNIIGLIIGIMHFSRSGISYKNTKVNYEWLIAGVKVAAPFLLGTLALRGLFVIDKFLFNSFEGAYQTASYILFSGMAGVIVVMLDSLVFVFLYPKMIKYFENDNLDCYKSILKELSLSTTFIVIIYIIGVLFFTPIILDWIGKESYIQNIHILWWLVAATSIFSFSMIPHYILYSQSKDNVLIASHLIGFFLFIVITILFRNAGVELVVPKSLTIVMGFMLIVKGFYALKYSPRECIPFLRFN